MLDLSIAPLPACRDPYYQSLFHTPEPGVTPPKKKNRGKKSAGQGKDQLPSPKDFLAPATKRRFGHPFKTCPHAKTSEAQMAGRSPSLPEPPDHEPMRCFCSDAPFLAPKKKEKEESLQGKPPIGCFFGVKAKAMRKSLQQLTCERVMDAPCGWLFLDVLLPSLRLMTQLAAHPE